MKWILIMLCSVARAEFNPVPTGDVKIDNNLKNVVEELKRVETAVTTTTWINAGIVISTTAGAPSQGVKFQDGTIQYTAAGAPTLSPQPAWQGVNYWLGGSSGTTVIYSTGASQNTTAVDSFHIVDSSWVVAGSICHTPDTLYTVTRSTITIAWLNTSCVLTVGGSTTTSWVSISSYTPAIGDGIPIAISSTGALGDIHFFTIVNDSPVPSYAASWAGRGATTNAFGTTTGAAPDPWWPCVASHNVLPSCRPPSGLSLVPTSMGRGYLNAQYAGASPQNTGAAFIVNNTASGAMNINFRNYSGGAYQISVDGGGLQALATGTNNLSVPVGTGRHGIMIQSASEGGIQWIFDENIKFVRPGPI